MLLVACVCITERLHSVAHCC